MLMSITVVGCRLQAPASITEDSPYWAAVTIVPPDAVLPLADGYFAVQVPPQLLAEARGQLAVRWIDFYR